MGYAFHDLVPIPDHVYVSEDGQYRRSDLERASSHDPDTGPDRGRPQLATRLRLRGEPHIHEYTVLVCQLPGFEARLIITLTYVSDGDHGVLVTETVEAVAVVDIL